MELRASLNKGISGELAKNFPNIQPVERPKVEKSIDRSYIYIYIYNNDRNHVMVPILIDWSDL